MRNPRHFHLENIQLRRYYCLQSYLKLCGKGFLCRAEGSRPHHPASNMSEPHIRALAGNEQALRAPALSKQGLLQPWQAHSRPRNVAATAVPCPSHPPRGKHHVENVILSHHRLPPGQTDVSPWIPLRWGRGDGRSSATPRPADRHLPAARDLRNPEGTGKISKMVFSCWSRPQEAEGPGCPSTVL